MALNRYILLNTVTIAWPPTWSEVVNGPVSGAFTTPAIPASPTGPVYNVTGQNVQVVITGGTVTVIAINGTTVATATGQTVALPAGGYIALTYSSAPTWTWSALPAQPAGVGPEVALVSGTAPAGGQAGVLPQTTFIEGMPIVLDPAGALYAAIGSSNLRAWIDGTDNVSHAALSN